MRTKTLLLSAAVGAVGLLAADAQVYSVNSVGYINKALSTAGYHLISNPLVPSGGGSDLNSLIPVAPDGALVFLWRNGGFDPNNPQFVDGVGWLPNTTISAGEGFFVFVDAPTTFTFVGEVRQTGGALTATPIPQGFSIVSSQVPQQAALSVLGLPGSDGDQVLRWDSAAQAYSATVPSYVDGLGWLPDATIDVGEAFFINAQANLSWTRTFSVNQ